MFVLIYCSKPLTFGLTREEVVETQGKEGIFEQVTVIKMNIFFLKKKKRYKNKRPTKKPWYKTNDPQILLYWIRLPDFSLDLCSVLPQTKISHNLDIVCFLEEWESIMEPAFQQHPTVINGPPCRTVAAAWSSNLYAHWNPNFLLSKGDTYILV